MSLQENIHNEERQLKEIFTAIDDGKSFIVHAGAGAGKTYTLIESINYILNHKLNTLRKHNQKIICITYTNVAVDEIRHRLGESQFVQVSTIHEMLWQQIKLYQQYELVELHKNKLEKEIENTKLEITKLARDFANLADINTEENKELFKQFVQENKNEFFKLENEKAQADKFRTRMLELVQPDDLKNALENALRNINNFKKIFKLTSRLNSYTQALAKINHPEEHKRISVEYDSNSNSDRLASLKFSHDTLLEYSLELVKQYDVFKKLLTDQYPYIFIDEYQDTNESVIRLMAYLQQYAHPERWLVGYFGDSKQNIYDSGVGNHIENIYQEISAEGKREIKLEKIVKEFNRRSQIQIINLINKIRNDELAQKPIDPDRTNGKVEFYCLKAEAAEGDKNEAIIDQFIAHLVPSLPRNEQINCLLLLNRSVASMSGFKQLYNAIEKAKFIQWDNLNSMLLSRILNKLHPAVLRLYQLVTAYNSLNNPHTTLYDLFGNTQRSVTFAEAGKLVQILKQQQPPATLNEFIQNISTRLNQLAENKNKSVNDAIKFWLKNCFGINYPKDIKQNNAGLVDLSFADYYINFLLYEEMYGSIDHADTEVEETDDVVATNQQHIRDILDIKLSQWLSWVAFINDEHDKEQQVIYHTYHGTKGEEYDNVVIIMENDFGKNKKNKFKNYFSSLSADENIQVRDEEDKELENTRNLFYTACSRARKNLWILYLDDINEIKDEIELLFGTVNTFEPAIE
ncbi:ATP-dependent DNA helicase pcrA [Snodgrassella communis]|uniref:UvrD-helicase domain-containing protein n=1 Tax=Snodgrassella communis TaxID=2946699 RepID=UPI0004611ACA|nr:ATP-dependent helicase [Snodgrassella communis]KDN12543.1 ATP-dependent DNA helicase pcrA [Snodgrassella communis]